MPTLMHEDLVKAQGWFVADVEWDNVPGQRDAAAGVPITGNVKRPLPAPGFRNPQQPGVRHLWAFVC